MSETVAAYLKEVSKVKDTGGVKETSYYIALSNLFNVMGATLKLTFWKNVPVKVWSYKIGGYTVLKKWLSYRDHRLLGRPLDKDEAKEFIGMIRRIAALLLLQPTLNANYQSVTHSVYRWQ